MIKTTQHDKEQGQALIEFALTLPILLVMILGIIDLARVLFGFAQVMDAARQGVRYGLVEGLERDTVQWVDCDGIRQEIKALPGLLPIHDSDITIRWKDSAGNTLPLTCDSTLTSADFVPGDMLSVTVSGEIQPITPVFSSVVSRIPFTYTASRSLVLVGADYAEEWLAPPQRPQNFSGTVDCALATGNNVSFTWDSLAPPPDRMEIRSAYTGDVIAVMDPANTAYCLGCARIETGGFDMYYIVGINGSPPSEVEGPPSDYKFLDCGSGTTVTITGGSITGTIWHDVNGDAIKDASDLGIANVAVYLESAGENGIWDGIGGDDVFYATATLNNGTFEFHSLEVPKKLTAQQYRVVLVPSSVNVALSTQYDMIDGVIGNKTDISDARQTTVPTSPVTFYLTNESTQALSFGFTSTTYYNWSLIPAGS